MSQNEKHQLIKNIERLVNPIDVGSIHFIQSFNRLLPKLIQEQLVKSSAKKYPYMGFVVEPYSYFLFYELTDLDQAREVLPDGFKLIKTKIFENDEPKYYAIFGCFTAHTSAFWGARIEFYIVAEDEKTGLLTWVITDYDSNTISHDKKHGLRSPSSSKAVITTSYDGNLLVDFRKDDGSRELIFKSDLKNGQNKNLDQRLWLEGNLSVCYGRDLSEGKAEVFSLKFDPSEVAQAWEMPMENLQLQANTWFPGLFKKEPSTLVCFPYAQHFVSDSPGHFSNIKNKEALIAATQTLDFDTIEVFSTKQFRTMMMLGMATSFFIITILLILLILK